MESLQSVTSILPIETWLSYGREWEIHHECGGLDKRGQDTLSAAGPMQQCREP